MISISHLTLLVHDQEAACKFYTEKLGFVIHTDAQYGDLRWLTLSPNDKKDFELIVKKADTPAEIAVVGKQAGDCVFMSLSTDDCRKDYALFKQRGVDFMQEPVEEFWGINTTFKDLYGNIFILVQPLPH